MKLVLLDIAIPVHLHDVVEGRSAQHLYYLDQLVDVALGTEDRLMGYHLG